jgi:hypothetical protein
MVYQLSNSGAGSTARCPCSLCSRRQIFPKLLKKLIAVEVKRTGTEFNSIKLFFVSMIQEEAKMSQQKITNRQTVVVSRNFFTAGSGGSATTTIDQKINISFTPDEMFVRYIGLSSVTDGFVCVKSSLHKDPLGCVFSSAAAQPNNGFKLGHDIYNTYSFSLSDISGNAITPTGTTFVALTLEFIKY